MGLREYIIRRLLLMIPVALGAVLLVFAVTQLLSPGQRAMLYVRSEKDILNIDAIIEAHHLNASVFVQFGDWFSALLGGNLGYSYTGKGPVLNIMLAKWPGTIEIVMLASPLIIILGIFLGVLSAKNRDKTIDHATRLFSISGYSLPSFWLGMVLIAAALALTGFYSQGRLTLALQHEVDVRGITLYTGLYTIDGLLNGRLDITIDAIKHLILPVTVITTINVAGLIRLMRSSMLEALTKGYMITARAKGLKEREVINKHARRNALIPVITVSGLMVAGLLGGLLITETVFNFGGLGSWVARAAGGGSAPDVAVVVGFTLFTALIFVVSNLIVDVLYAYIDPRIRLG